MIELIIISVLSALSVGLLISLIVSNRKAKDLAKELITLRDNSNESYVKFLKDSRDWSFSYIEEVQKAIEDFAAMVEPQLDYFNTYGRAIPSHNDIALDIITKAFSELKTVLPEENKEK